MAEDQPLLGKCLRHPYRDTEEGEYESSLATWIISENGLLMLVLALELFLEKRCC